MKNASKPVSIPQPVFYPRYCFPLAPTANTWCFFRACEIFALEQRDGFEGEGFFFYRNLPIKWVRIVGVVVAIDDFSGLRAYTVDDSSGTCIEAVTSLSVATTTATATAATNSTPTYAAPTESLAQRVTPHDIDVGAVVDVKGALTTFRDARQLKLESMKALRGTGAEVKLWAKRDAFRRDILNKPWVLQDKAIRKCRKEEERCEAETRKRGNRFRTASSSKGYSMASTGNKTVRNGNKDSQSRRSFDEAEELAKIVASARGGKYNALGL